MAQEQKIDLDSVLDYEWIYAAEIQKAKIDGDKLTGLCPFHDDKSPSLSVDLKTGKYHCFACGAGGNYTQFVAQKYGLSTKDAYKKILVDNGLEAGKKPVSRTAQVPGYSVAEYAMEKRLPVDMLKGECHMESGKDKVGPYLKIPYMDAEGLEVTFRKRYPKGAKRRFAWKYGVTVPCMYGMWRIAKIREAGYVVLVEGESDAQTLWTMDIPALGVPGATTFQAEWTAELEGLTVILHIEPDQGGEAFCQQMMRKLSDGGFQGTVKTFTVGPLGVKDPNELWCRDGDEAKAKLQNLIDQADEASLEQLVIANTVEGAPVALRQPDGWLFGEDGIWMVDDDGLKTNVCATPLLISKRLRNRDTGLERVEISFKRDGAWKSINVGRDELFTSRGIVRLTQYGLMVTSENARYIVRYLDALEKNNMDAIETCDSTEQTGWQSGGRFMPFFADGMVFDTQYANKLAFLCKNGTLDGWVNCMKPHRERWRFRFILASSFAAPLLSIVKCRIFCVYNWGSSLGGKTAALKASMSVWGDPDNLMCTYNGTDNAIEAYCATFNDLPVGIDERQISGATDKGLSSLIYKLCEGSGRMRLNKDSTIKATKTWRNIFMTTGEEPIISDRTMTGVSNRIIEIVGGPFDSKEQGAEMHRICAENCGWAGPAFLETVRDENQRAKVREEYGLFQRLIAAQNPDSNPNHIACIAAVAVADFRVSQLFFGESEAEAREHALSMCKSVLGNIRENLPDDVNKNAVRYLASWIGIHRANFGTDCKGPCYGYIEKNIAYLYPSAFQMAMDEGHYSTRKVRKYMAENGMMQYTMEGNKKLYSIVRKTGGRAERFVAIVMDKLTDPAEAGSLVLEDEVGQEELPFT